MGWGAVRSTLTCSHELQVVTGRMRSWIQAAAMSFLRRVSGLGLREGEELRHLEGARLRASLASSFGGPRSNLGGDPELVVGGTT